MASQNIAIQEQEGTTPPLLDEDSNSMVMKFIVKSEG